MVTESDASAITEDSKVRWFIDAAWYEQHNRSLLDLSVRTLCPACAEKVQKKKKKVGMADVLEMIKGCCAKTPEFITVRLPVLESAFRVLLANGNEPMESNELSRQMAEHRDGDTYTTSTQMLTRLLGSDRWYGFRKVTEKKS